jgi:hypothetical protein
MNVCLHQQGKHEPAVDAAAVSPTRQAFEEAVRKLNDRKIRVVIMLDEFEQLSRNARLDLGFFNALRSGAGSYDLVFLTASANSIFKLTYDRWSQAGPSSPFFNVFAVHYLGLLSEAEARELIRRPMEAGGIEVAPELESFIISLAGGHPLALQIACHHAWERPHDLAEIERQTMQQLEGHFDYYWRNCTRTEQELLGHLPGSREDQSADPVTREALRDLVRKCLLIQVNGLYSYPSRAWAEFVANRQSSLSPIVPTLEEPVLNAHDAPNEAEGTPAQVAPGSKSLAGEILPRVVGALVAGLLVKLIERLLPGSGIWPSVAAVVVVLALTAYFIWQALRRRQR